METESGGVRLERREEAGWLILSRPERMNSLDSRAIREIWSLLNKLEAERDIRAVVITGEGDRYFCAGMEMVGMERASPLAARRRSREAQLITRRISECSLPVVAAVNGTAMGLGLEICLACDYTVASREARFGFPEVRTGMIPHGGGTVRLPRLVGPARAKEMILLGGVLDASTALEWGLINEVVDFPDLSSAVRRVLEKLTKGGRMALWQAKRCINRSFDAELGYGLEYEAESFATCFATGEPAAGLGKFARGERGGETGGVDAGETGEEGGEEEKKGDIFE